MIKFNVKNILLATTAICAVSFFANNAKAEYTPIRSDDAAYTVSAGSETDYDFYTINTSGEKEYYKWGLKTGTDTGVAAPHSIVITKLEEAPASCEVANKCFKIQHGVDGEGAPVYDYFSYTLSTATGHYTDHARIENTTDRGNLPPDGSDDTGYRFVNANGEEEYQLGGAIYNKTSASTIGDITGDFIGNNSLGLGDVNGGAIYNNGYIDDINSDFIGNYAQSPVVAEGGAIFNTSSWDGPQIVGGFIGNINGNFIGNYAYDNNVSSANGGAIYNEYVITIGNITGDFIGNYAKSESSFAEGGAIGGSATIASINGDFIGNYAYSNSSVVWGGAISNALTISNITGAFIGNYAQGYSIVKGGAIRNGYIINNITGIFSCNYASATGSNATAYGGAIHSEGAYEYASMGDIIADFSGNYASATGSNATAYGGAIYNTVSSIGNITGNFTKNYAESLYDSRGGAIYNNATITNLTSNFVGNYALMLGASYAGGGAIYNYEAGAIENINGDFVGNYVLATESDSSQAFAGAIYNFSGTITTLTGNFIENYVQGSALAFGGAIFNDAIPDDRGIITTLTGDFIGNYALSSSFDALGGAIYNRGTITTLDGDFTDNFAKSESGFARGGAIYNYEGADIGDITGDFSDNYAQSQSLADGGAILNGGTIGDIAGSFNGNHASIASQTNGGAIANYGNIGNIIGNFTDNYTNSKSDFSYGGAIYNLGSSLGVIGDITGDFMKNYAESEASNAFGGAIHNAWMMLVASVGDIKGDFIENHVSSKTGNAYGGAIYNSAKIKTLTGNFIDNYAKSESGFARGGAIYNIGSINIYGVDYFNKHVASLIIATQNENILIKGNYVEDSTSSEKKYEAVNNSAIIESGCGSCMSPEDIQEWIDTHPEEVNDLAKITFKASANNSITLYDFVNGNDAGTLNFVSDDNEGATFNLYNDIKNQKDINFQAGYVLNMLSPEDIHEGTSALSYIQAKNITISAAIQMAVDVDLSAETPVMDMFQAETFTVDNNGSIVVNEINIVGNAAGEVGTITPVQFIEADTLNVLGSISTTVSEVVSGRYTYDVAYDEVNAQFVFTTKSIDPEPTPTPVRPSEEEVSSGKANAVANSMLQVITENVTSQVLNRDITATIGMNSGDAQTLSTWVQTFGSNDDVKLKHLSGAIDTQFYGVIGGVDSKKFTYENGLQAVYGVYGAYTGSRQKYDGNKIKQNGGYLGLSAALRKGALFNNVTLNGGYLKNEADTKFGKDKFDTKVVSVANKTGYDLKKDEWTFTPALGLSYMGIDTEDYTTKSGVKVKNKFMNVFTLAPELKVAKDFGEGLDGYAKVAYRMFFYDNNKVKANDVLLPSMSVKPYVEYGVGLTKDWSKEEWNAHDVTSYAEITRHDGGREGWNIDLGLKLDF